MYLPVSSHQGQIQNDLQVSSLIRLNDSQTASVCAPVFVCVGAYTYKKLFEEFNGVYLEDSEIK